MAIKRAPSGQSREVQAAGVGPRREVNDEHGDEEAPSGHSREVQALGVGPQRK